MTALVWFRRDLRVRDNPALRAALDAHEKVVPVFVFDERILQGRHVSGPRTQFMLECLADLDNSLRDRGGRLFVRSGVPERELVELARETGAREIHFAHDVSPLARGRGRRVAAACAEAAIELIDHDGLNAVDVRGIETKTGAKPYSVFSPFHRAWLELPRREVLEAPGSVPVPGRPAAGKIPRLAELGLEQEVAEPAPGGEQAARERLDAFIESDVADYADNHDALAADRTSRLSPYLHFGCVSPRQIEARIAGRRGKGPVAFRRQLCWRDFYHHLLFHNPENSRRAFKAYYRDVEWRRDAEGLEAWKRGMTGFPLVDAAMRQLAREGWMHNRARLVVGSFLTKSLGIDWREGEAHFMRLLIDGDQANNNGNWQWIASVGTDPQPVFRRIFNPARHQERNDPDGVYVRRYVPELAQVPEKYLPEPWEMPAEVQAQAGCVIGEDYPAPIVDYGASRREALDRYASAKAKVKAQK